MVYIVFAWIVVFLIRVVFDPLRKSAKPPLNLIYSIGRKIEIMFQVLTDMTRVGKSSALSPESLVHLKINSMQLNYLLSSTFDNSIKFYCFVSSFKWLEIFLHIFLSLRTSGCMFMNLYLITRVRITVFPFLHRRDHKDPPGSIGSVGGVGEK